MSYDSRPPVQVQTEYCARAERLFRLGALDVDMAEFFDVSESR